MNIVGKKEGDLNQHWFSLSFIAGRQTRERRPLQYSSLSSCPHLEESRDCSISSCYSWRLEKRDECFLPRGRDCGSGGTRKILFACIDYEGVSLKFPLGDLHTHTVSATVLCRSTLPFGLINFIAILLYSRESHQIQWPGNYP